MDEWPYLQQAGLHSHQQPMARSAPPQVCKLCAARLSFQPLRLHSLYFGNELLPLPCPFKLFNMWIKHETFPQLVAEKWAAYAQLVGRGTKQFRFGQILTMLKSDLKMLNLENFQHISTLATAAQQRLEEV